MQALQLFAVVDLDVEHRPEAFDGLARACDDAVLEPFGVDLDQVAALKCQAVDGDEWDGIGFSGGHRVKRHRSCPGIVPPGRVKPGNGAGSGRISHGSAQAVHRGQLVCGHVGAQKLKAEPLRLDRGDLPKWPHGPGQRQAVEPDVGPKIENMVTGAHQRQDAVNLIPRELAIDPQRPADHRVALQGEHAPEPGFGDREHRHI